MGQVLNLSESALDMALYGNKAPILNNYLQQQMSQLQPAFNSFANRIYDSIQSSYNWINDRMVQYGILNQLSQAGVSAIDNYYTDCLSFQQLQDANTTMQRWIMCHPQLNQYYLDQNIDGYTGSYQNVFGKGVGEDSYNYRRLTDEVLIDKDDTWQVNYYLEDLLPGDKELNHYEKVKGLHTHDCIDWILETCQFDFTNVTNSTAKINKDC